MQRLHIGSTSVLFALCCAVANAADPPAIDPQADRVLRDMTRYMANQKQFTATTENTIEAVTDGGQKIQFTVPGTITVSRPNKFVAQRRGDIIDQTFYYDGKTLTLYNVGTKHFATVPAPASIDAALDFARDTLDIIAPAADLIDTRAYERLTQYATSGAYLGLAVVGGHRCHHIAYRAGVVDWQLWVREGNQPLPCKYVVTSTDIEGDPQFTMQVTSWDGAPKITDSTFAFAPPGDARRIDFLPAAEARP